RGLTMASTSRVGVAGGGAPARAALNTPLPRLTAQWLETARRHGFGPEEARSLLVPPVPESQRTNVSFSASPRRKRLGTDSSPGSSGTVSRKRSALNVARTLRSRGDRVYAIDYVFAILVFGFGFGMGLLFFFGPEKESLKKLPHRNALIFLF